VTVTIRNASGEESGLNLPDFKHQRQVLIIKGQKAGIVLNGLAEYLGVTPKCFRLCTAARVLRAGEVFPLDEDVFLVAACFVDDKNLDGGEWRSMVEKTKAAMSSGEWEDARKKVRGLRGDMTAAGLHAFDIRELRASPSSVYLRYLRRSGGAPATVQVFDPAHSAPSPKSFSFRTDTTRGTIRFVA
jgi:hypothetical protein